MVIASPLASVHASGIAAAVFIGIVTDAVWQTGGWSMQQVEQVAVAAAT